jgi:adenosylmethionine-8-amino-7-oxononanoate aminotransferase
MCAVEFVQDRKTRAAFPPAERVGQRINAEAEKRGLISRVRGDIFLIAPPIVISDDQIDRLVDILADSVRAVLG